MKLGSKLSKVLAAFSMVAAGLVLPASAQSIDDILSKKKIVIGVANDLPPFGYLDRNGELDGYDARLAKNLAEVLGVELEMVPVSVPNRIPYLMSGRIDAVVATLAVTPERAKQVAFSAPYGDQALNLYAEKSKTITKPEETKGLRIAVTRGSGEEQIVREKLPEADVMVFDSESSTQQAVITGQADALVTSTIAFATLGQAGNLGEFESKLVLDRHVQSIGVRKDSQELLQWINTFLLVMKVSGRLNELHEATLGVPLAADLPSL